MASETEQLKNRMHSLAISCDLVKNIFLIQVLNYQASAGFDLVSWKLITSLQVLSFVAKSHFFRHLFRKEPWILIAHDVFMDRMFFLSPIQHS